LHSVVQCRYFRNSLAVWSSVGGGFAVLQTSLKINESILKKEKLKQEKVDSRRKTIWDAKDLKKGKNEARERDIED
jgi:hypothetical protein